MREIKNNESTREANLNNEEQYGQEQNVVKIQQGDLKKNMEPEIVGNVHNGKQISETLIENITSTEVDSLQLTDAIQCNNKENILSLTDHDLDNVSETKDIQTKNEESKDVQCSVGITEQDTNEIIMIDPENKKVAQDCKPMCNEEFNANINDSKNNISDSELSSTEKGEILKEHDGHHEHPDNTKIESEINQHPIENDNTETNLDTIHDTKNENDPQGERDTKRLEENELCTTANMTVNENSKRDIEDTNLSLELEPTKEKDNDEMQNEKSKKLQNHASNNSMDLETAAITIQKVFRSFLFRNKTQSIDDATNVDINLLIEEKEKKVPIVAF